MKKLLIFQVMFAVAFFSGCDDSKKNEKPVSSTNKSEPVLSYSEMIVGVWKCTATSPYGSSNNDEYAFNADGTYVDPTNNRGRYKIDGSRLTTIVRYSWSNEPSETIWNLLNLTPSQLHASALEAGIVINCSKR